VALERLLPRFAVTLLWYNPNLEPAAEHARRLAAVREVAAHFNVELLTPQPDPEAWLSAVADLAQEPEGGRRCEVCFLFRLRRTAQRAAGGGYQYFATTLTTGPQKRLEQIRQAGHIAAAEYGVQFLDESFRSRAGFQRSVELSKELSLYRQNYCGCRYSMR
jgi:predicted adenine nucleotide alpha hydrolase (AANH) superfamily ATPase